MSTIFSNALPANYFSSTLAGSNTTTTQLSGLVGQTAGSGLSQYYQTVTSPVAPYERERKVEVPVIDKTDRAGIFLRDEKGALVHVPAERLYKAMGIEW